MRRVPLVKRLLQATKALLEGNVALDPAHEPHMARAAPAGPALLEQRLHQGDTARGLVPMDGAHVAPRGLGEGTDARGARLLPILPYVAV